MTSKPVIKRPLTLEWNAARDAFLRREWDAGTQLNVLAANLMVDRDEVRARARDLGLRRRRFGCSWDDERDALLREGWMRGDPLDVIALSVGVSRGSLIRRKDALGLPSRSGDYVAKPPPATERSCPYVELSERRCDVSGKRELVACGAVVKREQYCARHKERIAPIARGPRSLLGTAIGRGFY